MQTTDSDTVSTYQISSVQLVTSKHNFLFTNIVFRGMEVAGLGPRHHIFKFKTENVTIDIITIIYLNTLTEITNFNQNLKIFIKNILNKWSWKDFLTIDKLLEKGKLKSNYLSILECGRADVFDLKCGKTNSDI